MTTATETRIPTDQPFRRRALGRPRDWNLRLPRRPRARPRLGWLGPLAIVGSVTVSWPAFSGATGEDGSVAFGLFIGATSILLMAWSFVLAVRLRPLEPFFGGLDSMYRSHRWAGSLAVVAMFLHVQAEPEIEGGIRGASRSLASSAQGLAGVGEYLLYVLVGLSLLRWIPYRYWRWTHKALGIPFAFACFHFYTAEKPYANGSAWGWWFGTLMVAGLGAYLWRVVWRDALAPGHRYRIVSAEIHGSTTELVLNPVGAHMRYEAGQFAVVKLQIAGLREPHVFTIAAAPDEGRLRFYVRDLGDWTAKIQRHELVGRDVVVEGPYGRFEPLSHRHAKRVWIAGGVGITPFLSATASRAGSTTDSPPLLIYCVRDRATASAIAELEAADHAGTIDLQVIASNEGSRFSEPRLQELAGRDLSDTHIAVCGPAGLVATADRAARALGAPAVETEDFDIRSGFGPDLSRDVDRLIAGLHAN